MIVNITGTSGSGKSYLVRSFLDWAKDQGSVTPVWEEGRTAPVGYKAVWQARPPWETGELRRWVYVLGSYEVPTGGCDTLEPVERIFSEVDARHEEGWDVLYEGLFMMNQTRGPQLAEKWGAEIQVLQLTTPLSECFASVDERRARRGAVALTKRDNTRQNYLRSQHYCARMAEAGAVVMPVTREAALERLLALLSGVW